MCNLCLDEQALIIYSTGSGKIYVYIAGPMSKAPLDFQSNTRGRVLEEVNDDQRNMYVCLCVSEPFKVHYCLQRRYSPSEMYLSVMQCPCPCPSHPIHPPIPPRPFIVSIINDRPDHQSRYPPKTPLLSFSYSILGIFFRPCKGVCCRSKNNEKK